MDLWKWVNDAEKRLAESGHQRLADLMDRIPSEVCDDHHERADALVPEALALAKGLNDPWIELFVRHWDLQSRILHRMDGRALGDAVSLVEFAHRDETRACPQAVCAVQDLAAAYGFVDGPGYAEERKEVSRETLERIDTSWSCFTCISSEYAGALVDQEDYAGALAYVEGQINQLAAAGERQSVKDMARSRIDALIGLERWNDALALLDDDEKDGRENEHHEQRRRIDRAFLFERIGRIDDAKAALPEAAEVLPTPFFYAKWAEARVALLRAGALPNDAELGATLQRFVTRLELQGVGRTTLLIAQTHGELALERGAPHVARRALAAMERAAGLLHRPLGALDRIARLRAAIAAAPGTEAITLPDDPSAVRALLEDEAMTTERALLVLEAAHARFPDALPVVSLFFGALMESGLEAEALALLEAFHERTNDDDALLLLGNHLTRAEHAERLAPLVERHRAKAATDESRSLADWLLARADHGQGRWRDCLAHLDAVLAARPTGINARLMYAEVARRLGDHALAIAKLDEVVELVPEPGPADWDRMTSAAVLGDWARVRESAKRIGYELEGEGPIDERMGTCRILIDEDAGKVAWARRISPVTARIVSVAAPPRTLRYLDVVAFDATPQNPPPASEEERADHTFIYPYVATLSKGGFRAFTLDGVHPGAEKVEAMSEAMDALGIELRVLSGEDYRVADDEEPGLYAALAVPAGVTDQAACAALVAAASGTKLTFVDLAEAAGEKALAEVHATLSEELDL